MSRLRRLTRSIGNFAKSLLGRGKSEAEKVIKDVTEKIEEKADKASEKIEDATEDVK